MNRQPMFSALFIVAFLCSSLGSVMYVESAAAGPSVPCDVKWNNNKNQVKNKHRSKYIDCLIVALSNKDEHPSSTNEPYELISDETWQSIITYRSVGTQKPRYSLDAVLGHAELIPKKNRRSVIACLEGNL
jgi:hypothetical protein